MTFPILFDLDGTLADFSAGLAAAMKPLESPGETHNYAAYDQDAEPEFMRARRRLVKQTPGFWRDLPRYEPGFKLLHLALDAGLRIVIFTKAPKGQPRAFMEKMEWCHKHLEGIDFDVSMVTDKGLHYGKILVDDWPPYIKQWLEHRPRGHVIMPAHPYNDSFRHAQVAPYFGHTGGLEERNISCLFDDVVRGIR